MREGIHTSLWIKNVVYEGGSICRILKEINILS